ncbi:MAG: metallophosphoesterase [Myxococcota bacterium]
MPTILLALALFGFPALAQDVEQLPPQEPGIAPIYADDGDLVRADKPITFAVIGNARPASRAIDIAQGRTAPNKGVTADLFADIAKSRPDAIILMGDQVRAGAKREYKRLSKAATATSLFDEAKAVPVAGNHEYIGDEKLDLWDDAFPGVGAEIGFSRTASWYAFQIRQGERDARFVVLDSGKNRLGSRWREQMEWLPDAVGGRFDDLIIIMHDPLYDLSGRTPQMNPLGAPEELLEEIEMVVEISKIRAIITAGGHTNQIMRPDGPLGTLHVVAGGGGAPGQDLSRWTSPDNAGRTERLSLDPLFDVSLLKSMDGWSEANPIPENILDEARATGSFEGFTGVIDAKAFPTYGWFSLTVAEDSIQIGLRHRLPDGTIEDRYRVKYTEDSGWLPDRS